MSKITEYEAASTFDVNDVLIKDGENGTMIISVEDAASEFKRLGGIDDDISDINQSVTQAMDTIDSNIAGVETDYIASKDYAIGDLFIVNNVLYKATAAIAEEDVIDTEVNCVIVNLGNEIGDIRSELANKANIDGSYSTLTAGNAEQLVGTVFTEDDAAYTFRTSGGSADIGDREYDEIVGGSIVWNQMAPAIDSWAVYRDTTSGSLTDDGYVFQVTSGNTGIVASNTYGSVKKDHIYFKTFEFKPVDEFPSNCYTYWPVHSQTTVNIFISGTAVGSWGTASVITKASDNKNYYQMAINLGSTGSNADHLNKKIAVRNPQVFDLTQMFGSEIADYIYNLEQTTPGAGVAWFRKYFPKDYYEYNAGELMHVSDLQSHDMVGFNAFDASTAEDGYMFTSTAGIKAASANLPRSCELVPVLPNTTYYLKSPRYENVWNAIFLDIDKNGLNGGRAVASGNSGVLFTTPANCYYVGINMLTADKGEINLNLSWDGERDGEYEPYVKHSYPLDSSLTLRGIPKLSTDGKLYYDGDHYKSDGTVERRYGIVDLGTLDWQYIAADGTRLQRFGTSNLATVKKRPTSAPYEGGLICEQFTPDNSPLNSRAKDKCITSYSDNNIYITDSAYTDAASFKAAMSGVYLVYELAEPTTEEAQPFQSPQIVDDFGTEEYVTSSIVPVGHITQYDSNLRAKLEMAPNSPDGDGDYLVRQTGGQNEYVSYTDGGRITALESKIPAAPSANGSYILKCTVTDGTATYAWVAE